MARTPPKKSRTLAESPDARIAQWTGLLRRVGQLIIVEPAADIASPTASCYERLGGRWRKRMTMRASIGHAGFALPGRKREGDGKTPSGIFALGHAFGYAPVGISRLRYRQCTVSDKFIDDPKAPDYNRWVRGNTAAKSYESMRRPDRLYEFGVIVRYNMDPVIPGGGSAIFLHVRRAAGDSTEGCIAFDRRNLQKLLRWLDPHKNPRLMINPHALAQPKK